MPNRIDRVLQKDLLAIMLKDVNVVTKFRRIIKPNFFSVRSYRFLYNKILEHVEKFNGELPSSKFITIQINKIKDDDKEKEFKEKILPIFGRKIKSPNGIIDEIHQWAEKQKFGIILERAARKGAEGDLNSAKNIIKSSFLFDIADSSFKIHSVFEEWKKRQRQRKVDSKKIKKLIIETELGALNDYLRIKRNQSLMGLIMGTSGVGKSIISINFGIYALNSGCNVAHFVFENTAQQTLTRYDSRLIEYPYSYLSDYNWNKKDLTKANKIMRRLKKRRSKALKVIHAPIDLVSVSDVESILKELEMTENWTPNIIIYDSGDHMIPTESQESYRLSVKKTYTEIKRQSELRNIPIFSTTHAKASARGTKVRQESFSEAYDKARLADVVLTISQTQEEEDDRIAQLWLDKWRDGEGKIGILVELLFRVMTIKYIERIEKDED